MLLSETAINLAKTASVLLEIPESEAIKAKAISHNNVLVTEKVTVRNFYKNPSFWSAFGLAIVSGAAGDYVGTFTQIIHLVSSL